MYKLKRTSFSTDKLELKRNNIKPGNFVLHPKLSRRTGKISENVFFTSLILDVQSTDEKPFPVNLFVAFKAVFEFSEIDNDLEIDNFLKTQAVHIMYPYLRSIVTNLTSTAMMPPIILPIVDVSKLFKDNNDSILIN